MTFRPPRCGDSETDTGGAVHTLRSAVSEWAKRAIGPPTPREGLV